MQFSLLIWAFIIKIFIGTLRLMCLLLGIFLFLFKHRCCYVNNDLVTALQPVDDRFYVLEFREPNYPQHFLSYCTLSNTYLESYLLLPLLILSFFNYENTTDYGYLHSYCKLIYLHKTLSV